MRFGSLFSGIGGLDLGLERAGMECAWQVENDEYCQRVLHRHWPSVVRWGDVREFPPNESSDLVAGLKVDCIAGGFPCQDISYAGAGAGLSGERSGLFFETIRVVRLLRPEWVLLENVAALLTRGLDRVHGELAQIGYHSESHCIPAAAVGAPHIRDRVFIVGRHDADPGCGQRREGGGDAGDEAKAFAHRGDSQRLRSTVADANRKRLKRIGAERKTVRQGERGDEPDGCCSDMADTNDARPQRRHGEELPERTGQRTAWTRDSLQRFREQCAWWNIEPDVGRVANGVSSRVDRLRGLGNAVVPQVAQWVGEQIMKEMG